MCSVFKRQTRNEDMGRAVDCTTDKVHKSKLRWRGHVKRREENSYIRKTVAAKCMVIEAENVGNSEKTWSNKTSRRVHSPQKIQQRELIGNGN